MTSGMTSNAANLLPTEAPHRGNPRQADSITPEERARLKSLGYRVMVEMGNIDQAKHPALGAGQWCPERALFEIARLDILGDECIAAMQTVEASGTQSGHEYHATLFKRNYGAICARFLELVEARQ